MAEIIKIELEKAITYDEAVSKVVKCLENGGLVALPTETVYGIAARADKPEYVKKLLEVRKSPQDKNLTIAIGNKEQMKKFIKVMAPSTARIVDKFMPGPITIVFDYENVGIRLPNHPFTCQVLANCYFPVVLPSANLSGEQPKVDSKEIIKEFNNVLDIIVAAGPTKYQTSSTVIRSGFGILQELRSGPLDFAEIRRTARITILFVCTGNTCRSPLAEIMLKSQLAQKYEVPIQNLDEIGFRILSCGIATFSGLGANTLAIETAKNYNLDLSNHKTTQITRELVEEADLIFCMTDEHIEYIVKNFPESLLKLRKLKSNGEDIEDPAFLSIKEYQTCAQIIKEEVGKIAKNL
jgi:protein-tyrosine phosphatase